MCPCRQRAICGLEGGENRYGRYQDLFTAPTGSELEAQYQQIAGDAYSTIDPTLANLIDAVDNAQLRSDSAAAREVCDDSIYQSMDLDEIIISCIFHHVEGFCPSSDSSEGFQTFLKSMTGAARRRLGLESVRCQAPLKRLSLSPFNCRPPASHSSQLRLRPDPHLRSPSPLNCEAAGLTLRPN